MRGVVATAVADLPVALPDAEGGATEQSAPHLGSVPALHRRIDVAMLLPYPGIGQTSFETLSSRMLKHALPIQCLMIQDSRTEERPMQLSRTQLLTRSSYRRLHNSYRSPLSARPAIAVRCPVHPQVGVRLGTDAQQSLDDAAGAPTPSVERLRIQVDAERAHDLGRIDGQNSDYPPLDRPLRSASIPSKARCVCN